MDDGNNVQTDEQPQTRRGRKPKRRSYAKDFEKLQGKVAMSIAMLRRAKGDLAERIAEIVLETLEES